jgi:hypothetical protein
MPAKRIWTEQEVLDICQRYKAKQTRVAIARQYGTKPETIRKILVSSGVALRRDTGKWLHKYTPEAEAEIVARFVDGETMTTLQLAYHMQPITLRRILARHGHVMSCVGRPKGRPKEKKPRPARVLRRTERHINHFGYVEVLVPPDHLMAGTRQSIYILEHRAVMAEHLGRALRYDETVHHVNGDKTDNRIENLQLRQGKHGNGVIYVCQDCGSHNVKSVEI